MKSSKAARLISFLSFLVFVGGIIAFPVWNFHQPPFNLKLLNDLDSGMSKEMVREILGSPKSDSPDSWSYSKAGSWPIVYIRFDENGKFSGSEYDR